GERERSEVAHHRHLDGLDAGDALGEPAGLTFLRALTEQRQSAPRGSSEGEGVRALDLAIALDGCGEFGLTERAGGAQRGELKEWLSGRPREDLAHEGESSGVRRL